MTISDATPDPFPARTSISTALGERAIYRLDFLRDIGDIDTIPCSIKVLAGAVLRNYDRPGCCADQKGSAVRGALESSAGIRADRTVQRDRPDEEQSTHQLVS